MGILVHGVDLLETYSNRRSRREINGKRNSIERVGSRYLAGTIPSLATICMIH